jgi:hypothetical protein
VERNRGDQESCASFSGTFVLPKMLTLARLSLFEKILIMKTHIVLVTQWGDPNLHDIQNSYRAFKPVD